MHGPAYHNSGDFQKSPVGRTAPSLVSDPVGGRGISAARLAEAPSPPAPRVASG